MKLVYPACFYEEEDGSFSVYIPDLPGCVTQGKDFAEAMEMAVDAASGWILSSLENGEEIPKPSKAIDITLDYENGTINHILLDMDSYAEKYGNKAVRKNTTIPAWLVTIADKHNENYSRTLQEALQQKYASFIYNSDMTSKK